MKLFLNKGETGQEITYYCIFCVPVINQKTQKKPAFETAESRKTRQYGADRHRNIKMALTPHLPMTHYLSATLFALLLVKI